MPSSILAQSPPRPLRPRAFPSQHHGTFQTRLCTILESLTPMPSTINARQFPVIYTSRPFGIRTSAFFRHSSLLIRHSPALPPFLI